MIYFAKMNYLQLYFFAVVSFSCANGAVSLDATTFHSYMLYTFELKNMTF